MLRCRTVLVKTPGRGWRRRLVGGNVVGGWETEAFIRQSRKRRGTRVRGAPSSLIDIQERLEATEGRSTLHTKPNVGLHVWATSGNGGGGGVVVLFASALPGLSLLERVSAAGRRHAGGRGVEDDRPRLELGLRALASMNSFREPCRRTTGAECPATHFCGK